MRLFRVLIILYFLITAASVFAQDASQIIVPGRDNSEKQIKKHYVILISADGFRYDFAKKYHADHLEALSKKGVAAAWMQPSFPSLTFPNHYSIITGLYPAHHGLVDNSMYDRKKNASYSIGNHAAVTDSSWYGGMPLWVLAEDQKMVSASYYWVGSEAAVDGVRPTYYYAYSDKTDIDTRIQTVKQWLQLPGDQRPHFITFYMPEVDHAAHKYGPESDETAAAVKFVDEAMKKMTDTLAELNLDIDYIFLSDHGMTTVDTKNTLGLPAAADTSKFKVAGGSALVHLYAKDPADIMPAYNSIRAEAKDYDVWLPDNMPARFHYSHKDDTYGRVGDIILIPHLPKVFNLNGKYPPQTGQHGFDPEIPEMRATFYAWGPDFKKNKEIPGFENVNVYPLIAKLLGLTITDPVDGNLKVLQPVLR